MNTNKKLEIAKLATQLTIALVESKSQYLSDVTHKAKVKAKAKGEQEENTSDVLIVFDVIFDHIESRLEKI